MFQFQMRLPAAQRAGQLFNQVRMYEGQPVRLWSAPNRGLDHGRYVIFPDGRMIYVPHFQVARMDPAPAEAAARAFPPQQQGARM